jgi:hypothetical protein
MPYQIWAVLLRCGIPRCRQFALKSHHEHCSESPYTRDASQSVRCKGVTFGPCKACDELEHGALGGANGKDIEYRGNIEALLEQIALVNRHSPSIHGCKQRNLVP